MWKNNKKKGEQLISLKKTGGSKERWKWDQVGEMPLTDKKRKVKTRRKVREKESDAVL